MNGFDGTWGVVLAPWAFCFVVNAVAIVIGVRLWHNRSTLRGASPPSTSALVVGIATLLVTAATLGSLASVTMVATAGGGESVDLSQRAQILTFGLFHAKLVAFGTLVGTPVALAILVYAAVRGSGRPIGSNTVTPPS
jgi:hypothetical protein